MRVLVTGGAGYIGSHTVLALLRAGNDVHVVDNLANASEEAIRRVSELAGRDCALTVADIRDAAALDRAMEDARPEAVIHFAGLKAVGESEQIPLEYYDQNVAGTITLLKAMGRAGCQRIVFSSSATVYGLPRYLPLDEAHPLGAINPYGRTKQFCEEIIRDWARTQTGRHAILLRYFNPVGADASGRIGEDPTGIPNNLMPFIAQVAVGRRDELKIFGGDWETRDGTGERDYIHVSDLAVAHVQAMDKLDAVAGCEAVNVGTGKGATVLEIVKAFGAASGRDIPYAIVDRRPGDVASSVAAVERAASLLGWQARHGIEEMCASTWTWQSENPHGYRGADAEAKTGTRDR